MAKDANPQDQNTETVIDLDAMLSKVDMEGLSDEMRELIEAAVASTKALEAKLEKKVQDKKEREPKTFIERLVAAEKGDPKGINLAAIQYANDSDESEAVLDSYARLLEATPGVTVNRKELKMSLQNMQWHIRFYNGDPVRALVPPKEAKADAGVTVTDPDPDDEDD